MDKFRQLWVNFSLFSPHFDLFQKGVRFGFQTLSKNVIFLTYLCPQFKEKIMIKCCFRGFDLLLSQFVCIGDKSLRDFSPLTTYFFIPKY